MIQFDDNQFYPVPPRFGFDVASAWGKDAEYTVPVVSPMGNGPKGEKGDKMTFADFTQHDVDEIRRGILASANKCIDETIVTSGTSTETIEIPIADYDPVFDMLFVDVNGLDICEDDDFLISGHSIILTTPLPAGQEIHFRVLRYLVPDGDKTIMNAMGRKDYNTVVEMQADDELKSGDICHTLGFHEPGDGGAAWYKIVAHAAANGIDILERGDCFAVMVYEDAGFYHEEPTYVSIGATYFDQELNKPLWWNGSEWVDAEGTAIE